MLYGERIYLRMFEERDVPDRVRWFNDDDVREQLHVPYPFSEIATRQWLQKAAGNDRRRDFSICMTADRSAIGFCGLVEIDWLHSKAETYIVIGEKAQWGQGFARDAVRLMLEYAFQELRLNRVYAYTTNERVVSLMNRLGFEREGTLREDAWSHGKFHDRILMGVTAKDFRKECSSAPPSEA